MVVFKTRLLFLLIDIGFPKMGRGIMSLPLRRSLRVQCILTDSTFSPSELHNQVGVTSGGEVTLKDCRIGNKIRFMRVQKVRIIFIVS